MPEYSLSDQWLSMGMLGGDSSTDLVGSLFNHVEQASRKVWDAVRRIHWDVILGPVLSFVAFIPFVAEWMGTTFNCNFEVGGPCGSNDTTAAIYSAAYLVTLAMIMWSMGTFPVLIALGAIILGVKTMRRVIAQFIANPGIGATLEFMIGFFSVVSGLIAVVLIGRILIEIFF